MCRDKTISITLAMALGSVLLLSACVGPGERAKISWSEETLSIGASVDKSRAKAGETIKLTAVVKAKNDISAVEVKATILIPAAGTKSIDLRLEDKDRGIYTGVIELGQDASEGLYVITVYATDGSSKAIGKTWFLIGKVIGDFLCVSILPQEKTEEDINNYLKDFLSLGGNMIVVHGIMSDQAWYPSRICKTAAVAGSPDDRVGHALKLADKLGLSALISVSWDTTHNMPYSQYMESIKAILSELWELYREHPSLAGFYSYQEGSGTYFVSYLREFCDAIKGHNSGLLTACAPYIDDPLLSGYLAAIESLDIVIWQGAVMASYRPDNRQRFPLRRIKDFCSLSSGGTLIKDKITLSHVELFGYHERAFANAYLASYDDTYAQVLSAACSYGQDGIVFFMYHYNVHEMSKKTPEARNTGLGVRDGLQAYKLITKTASAKPNCLALYYPYADWCVERWTACFVPALDGFRRLGVSVDIIPFIPRKGEEILPYYPMNLNEEQLKYLLNNKIVLVLPDISGMQETDSILLKTFVKNGGVAVLFGPRIPFGDCFDRTELCGGEENPPGKHSQIEVKEELHTRVKMGTKLSFESTDFHSWTPTTARKIAVFEDGRAAVLMNEFGKGKVFTIPIAVRRSVRIMPDLIRDILDCALSLNGLKRPFDVMDASEDLDIAMSSVDGEDYLTVVNYKKEAVDIKIRPLNITPDRLYKITDLRAGETLFEEAGEKLAGMKIRIKAVDYVIIRLSPK